MHYAMCYIHITCCYGSTQHAAHALRFPLDSGACLSVYLRNLQLHRRGVMDNMGGVYTAPTLLILLYSTVVVPQQRALLERAPSSISSVSQASSLANPRCIAPVFYCISCIIVTLTLWYLTHRSLSGHSTWVMGY